MDSSIMNSDLFDAEMESDEDEGGPPHDEMPDSGAKKMENTSNDLSEPVPAAPEDPDSSDDENICRKRKIKRPAIIDDDEENEDECSQNDGNTRNSDDEITENVDDSDTRNPIVDAHSDEDENEEGDERKLSGGEDKNDDEGSDSDGNDSDSAQSENEENLEEKIGRWTNSKGAAKAAKKERPQQRAAAKRSMDEMKNIHSETQRMVREGEMKMPYHHPKRLTLDDFRNKKKTLINVLRPTPEQIRKMSKVTPTKPRVKRQSQNSSEESTKNQSQDSQEELTHKSTDEGVSDLKTQSQDKADQDLRTRLGLDDDSDGEELPELLISDLKVNKLPEISDLSSNMEQSGETVLPATADSGLNSLSSQEVESSQEFTLNCAEKSENSEIHKSKKSTVLNGASDFDEIETCAPSQNTSDKQPLSDIQLNSDIPLKSKTKLWSKLNQDISDDIINLKPCIGLAAADNDFIDFDSDSENVKPKSGIGLLQERLMQHSAKPSLKSPVQVKVNIVKKEIDEENHEEHLKLETMTLPLMVEKENDPALNKPGAKLGSLKEQLKKAMKLKREEALKKRMESYEIENEEGYDEEEAELTDESDTDGEEEEENEGVDGEIVETEENEEEEEEENPFADDQAEEEQSESEMNLKLDQSEDEADDDEGTSKTPPTSSSSNSKKLSLNFSNLTDKITGKYSEDLSIEEETLPDLIVVSDKQRASPTTPDLFSQLPNMQTPKTGQNDDSSFKIPPLTLLPIEDSQDLYSDAQSERSCNQINLFVEESQSQLLDDEGFLKVRSSAKKQPNRELNLAGLVDSSFKSSDASNELLGLCSGNFSMATGTSKSAFALKDLVDGTQKPDTMDELAGLCSGNFTSSMSTQKPTGSKGMFDSTQNPDSMDELVGLCSGRFIPTSFGKSSQEESDNDGEDNVDGIDDFEDDLELKLKSDDEDGDVSDNEDVQDNLDSDEDIHPKRKQYDENEDEEEDDDELEEDDMLEEEFPPSFRGFHTKKKGKIRKEFVEQEAELSGSEAGSDEDLDLDERDDVMEAEAGDADFVGSESHLRDQVGRVHLKSLIDEDKRQLRLMQEMYLPDGDLHSEGAGRQRRFAWKHLDEDLSQDMFDDDNSEFKDDENENEIKWRKERFERERWLAEQKKDDDEVADESSQFLKLSSMALKKSIGSKETSQKTTVFRTQKKGSFLKRKQKVLDKITEATKPMANPGQAVNKRNLVFSTVSPNMKMQERKKTLSRSISVAGTPQPPRKKPKLEHSNSTNSIFNHF